MLSAIIIAATSIGLLNEECIVQFTPFYIQETLPNAEIQASEKAEIALFP